MCCGYRGQPVENVVACYLATEIALSQSRLTSAGTPARYRLVLP